MTINEFKAWYSGFCEGIPGAPTAAQWNKIRQRIAQLDGNDTTCSNFHALYMPTPAYRPIITNTDGTLDYDSCVAMRSLGKFEAKA